MAQIAIHELAGGEVLEWFSREMDKAIANINDVHTPVEAVRKVVMEITIKPNADRTYADVIADIYCKLPHEEKISTSITLDVDLGEWKITPEEIKQAEEDANSGKELESAVTTIKDVEDTSGTEAS